MDGSAAVSEISGTDDARWVDLGNPPTRGGRRLPGARKRTVTPTQSEKGDDHRHSERRKRAREIGAALKERVKELTCLYRVSSILETHGSDIDEVLTRIVRVVPDAWQYPEIASCRLCVGERVIQSPGFVATPWRQSQEIVADGRRRGMLEVAYRRCVPESDEGPFLREERSLIKVIAERIGKALERHDAGQALLESEQKIHALLDTVPDVMFQVDRHGTLVGFHEGAYAALGEIGRKLVGRNVSALADEEDLLPRSLLDQGMCAVGRALATGKPQVYEQHLSWRGQGRDVEVRMVVSRADEVLGIARDITDRKRLEREILEISNREQRRIGQDLHDSLCQHLTGIAFMGKVLEKKVASGRSLEPADIREIVALVDHAITLTRGFAAGLNPVGFGADGLVHALRNLVEDVSRLFGVECSVACSVPIFFDDNGKAIHLYRIAQEALTNAVKHGRADRIRISLTRRGAASTLTVSDNGVGYGAAPSRGGGMGLSIMRYRASMFGAAIDIRRRPRGGTTLACRFQSEDGPA